MYRSVMVAALVAVATPALASAQSLQYQTTTRSEISGVVGKLISKMGGMGEPMVETTSIQGSKIRKDEKETSQIMDWDTGTLTMLDHKAKTFTRVTFAQMADAMSAGMEQARTEQAAQQAAPAEEQPQVQLDVKVSTDRTGLHENIAGYDAEQVVVTMDIVATAVPEGETEAQQGGMAIVSDLWMSTDFPEQKLMEAMQGEALNQFRESVANGQLGATMQAMSSYDPRVKVAWEKNADALKDLKGTALRSTIQFVSLPPGVSLDGTAVLAAEDQALGSGIDVTGAAAKGAADAAKKALGGLAGRFGRKKEEPKEAEAPTPTQSVFMRMRTEIGSVVEGTTLPADLFEVPAGYTERPFSVPGGL
jgi:hypothetical protein